MEPIRNQQLVIELLFDSCEHYEWDSPRERSQYAEVERERLEHGQALINQLKAIGVNVPDNATVYTIEESPLDGANLFWLDAGCLRFTLELWGSPELQLPERIQASLERCFERSIILLDNLFSPGFMTSNFEPGGGLLDDLPGSGIDRLRYYY